MSMPDIWRVDAGDASSARYGGIKFQSAHEWLHAGLHGYLVSRPLPAKALERWLLGHDGRFVLPGQIA